MRRPWETPGVVPESEGGWSRVQGPSAIPFNETFLTPHEMTESAVAEGGRVTYPEPQTSLGI